MKKVLLLVLVFAMVFAVAPVVANYDYYAYDPDIEILSITIDGEIIDIPEEYGAMIMYNNRTMVPVRFVSEFLNFGVDWIEVDQIVVFRNADYAVMFQIGQYGLILPMSNQRVTMDAPAMIYNNRSYIPVRFFAEAIGMTVEWDEYTRTVYLAR